jgi:hypothetical protein
MNPKSVWNKLPRITRLSRVFYPDHTDANSRLVMNASATNEGKRPPQGPKLLGPHERGYVSPLGGQMAVPKGRFTIQRTR